MPKTCLIVEGLTDVRLLQKALPKKILGGLRFFAGQGRISSTSVARNIVVHEGCPVFVVRDADTLDSTTAEEANQYTRMLISHVGGDVLADVFAFLPELEVVFFEAPGVLAKLLGRELHQAELERGLASPKQTIRSLVDPSEPSGQIESLISRIDDEAAESLRRGKQLADLIKRLRRFLAPKTRSQRSSR